MWTRDAIESLPENELSRQVLIPLFTAMGYRDVRFYGGGPGEQGKDIVMWYQEPLRRTNLAVVVKATPITGAATSASVVLAQIKQAFNDPYLDTATHETREIHQVFVVTPHEVKKEGTNTLDVLLRREPFERQVTVIDGAELWRRLREHLGARTVLPELFRSVQTLQEIAGGFGLSVESIDGNHSVVLRGNANESVVFQPRFKETAEGEQARHVLEQFGRTGETSTVPMQALDGLPVGKVAALLDTLGVSPHDGGTITLRHTSRPIRGRLIFRSSEGEATIPHVEMHPEGGTAQLSVRVTVPGEVRAPFEAELHFRLDGAAATDSRFNLTWRLVGHSAFWLRLHHDLLRVISKGAAIHFQDFHTGIEHHLGRLSATTLPNRASNPVERLAWIEQMVKQPILTPARDFFTDEDLHDIYTVATIITDGQIGLESAGFTVVVKEEAHEVVEKAKNGKGVLRLEEANFRWQIFDSVLDLGPMEFRAIRAIVRATPEPSSDGQQHVRFELTAGPKSRLIARFPMWGARRKRSR